MHEVACIAAHFARRTSRSSAVRELLRRRHSGRRNSGVLVKSPVDLVVGALRGSSWHPRIRDRTRSRCRNGPEPVRAAERSQLAGEEAWINSNALLARKQSSISWHERRW
jgi:hypothetical protein